MRTTSHTVTSFLRKTALPPVLAAACFAALSGCAKKDKSPAEQPAAPAVRAGSISGLAYTVIDGETAGIRLTGSDVSGDGTLLFHVSPGAVDSNVQYRLMFAVEDGGSLSLVSHASESLADGTGITLGRSGETLSVQAVNGDGPAHPLTEPAASSDISLTVTVHNAESPPHITVASAAVVFDSLADKMTSAQGKGERFGIRLSRAVLKNISFEAVPDDGHAEPQEFTVADLHTVGQKAISRFERMAIASSTFVSYKTWKTSEYIWVRLTYSIPDTTAADGKKEDMFYMACHFHGKDMGCHKKDDAGSDEPKDEVPGDDPFPIPDPDL